MAKRRRPGRQEQYEDPLYRELQDRIARAIKRLRKRRRWTQEEAAHRCGMSTRLLQQAEARASNLTLTTLARLAKGFEVDPRELLAKPRRSPRRVE